MSPFVGLLPPPYKMRGNDCEKTGRLRPPPIQPVKAPPTNRKSPHPSRPSLLGTPT